MIAFFVYFILSMAYGFFAAWILRGLREIRAPWPGEIVQDVSVIIAARNEEQNLAYCLGTLLKQSYPREKLEILVVDDHSEDDTRTAAERVAAKYPLIKVIPAPPHDSRTAPKKAALAAGIAAASGQVLLTLDADCAAPPRWAEKMSGAITGGVTAAASWVLIPEEKNIFAQIEFLDTLALQLIGAAAIGWEKPFLANGANLAFLRQAFLDIKGYEGFAQMGSGDDDLFLQKLHASGKAKIIFAIDPDAAVTTFPSKSWNDFFQQRIRWSSKASLYPSWVKITEAGAFFYYLALLFGLPLALMLSFPAWIPLLALAAKMTCDGLVMRRGVRMVRRTWNWPPFFLASLLHIAYIPVVGLLGQFGRFEWKGRSYRHGRLEESGAMPRRP
jgi:glycosyltransferase involved in cell wall biosynthesis